MSEWELPAAVINEPEFSGTVILSNLGDDFQATFNVAVRAMTRFLLELGPTQVTVFEWAFFGATVTRIAGVLTHADDDTLTVDGTVVQLDNLAAIHLNA